MTFTFYDVAGLRAKGEYSFETLEELETYIDNNYYGHRIILDFYTKSIIIDDGYIPEISKVSRQKHALI